MREIPVSAIWLLSASLLCSCGTIQTQFSKQEDMPNAGRKPLNLSQIYSGTSFRMSNLSDYFARDTWHTEKGPLAPIILAPIFLIDTILCIPADTLLLPYTIPKQSRIGYVHIPSFEEHYGYDLYI